MKCKVMGKMATVITVCCAVMHAACVCPLARIGHFNELGAVSASFGGEDWNSP